MKKKSLISYVAVFAAVILVSASGCKKEESSTGNCNNLTAMLLPIQQQAAEYAANPTPAKCQALKSAAVAFFEKLEKCDSMEAKIMKESAMSWKNLDCSAN